MSEKLLVSADDPTITCRPYVERLKATKNPRHRLMLQTIIDHDQAEARCDIEDTMATVSDNPEYGRYWSNDDIAPVGREQVREFYEALFAVGGIGNIRSDAKRLVVDDNAVVVEFMVTMVWPWWRARGLGCHLVEDDTGHYAIRRPLTTIIPFDEGLKIIGEISYGGAAYWSRVPDDDVSPGYLAWVDRWLPRSGGPIADGSDDGSIGTSGTAPSSTRRRFHSADSE